MTNKGILYALLTAIVWSTSGIFIKSINQAPLVISGMTSIVGLLFILLVNRNHIKITKVNFMIGMIQFLMNITFVFANKLTSVGNAIVLQYSSMIFILILNCIRNKKIPYWYQLIVIIFAIIGMVLFFIDEFSFDSLLGNIIAIISGFFFGLQFYLNGKNHSETSNTFIAQYMITIFAMLIYIMMNGLSLTLKDTSMLICSGIFQTFLAACFFARCIKYIPAFSANVICMSEVIFAPIWSFLLFHEQFTASAFWGACIMIIALLFNVYMDYQYRGFEK